MLSDIEKVYWTKVYVTYGTDYGAWVKGDLFADEYWDTDELNGGRLGDMGYLDDNKFNQKFIDEVVNA